MCDRQLSDSSGSSGIVVSLRHWALSRLVGGVGLLGVLLVPVGVSAQTISQEALELEGSSLSVPVQPSAVRLGQLDERSPNVEALIHNSSIHQDRVGFPENSVTVPVPESRTGFVNPHMPLTQRGPYYPAALDAALPFPQPILPELSPELRLVIRLSERRVYLYNRDDLQVSYPIAVGRAGWETPVGTHEVIDMVVDPGWQNPFTGAVIPPGPSNPLGDRWIGFWTDGQNYIGFHGTPNEGSVGRAASHGCIRMYNRDVRELFEKVAVGTPVVVEP